MEYAIRSEVNNFKSLTYDDMLNIEGGFWAELGKALLVTVAVVAIATAPITIGLAVIGGACACAGGTCATVSAGTALVGGASMIIGNYGF